MKFFLWFATKNAVCQVRLDVQRSIGGNAREHKRERVGAERLQDVDLRCGCCRLSLTPCSLEGHLQEHHKPLVQGTEMKETNPCPCKVHKLEGERDKCTAVVVLKCTEASVGMASWRRCLLGAPKLLGFSPLPLLSSFPSQPNLTKRSGHFLGWPWICNLQS